MCEPTTIMTAMAIASASVSAYSANEQGENAKSVARFNAREAENEATLTRNRGVEEENKHREKVEQLKSKQRAQLGAANVDLNTGSALQIQEDTALLGEVDSLRIRTNFQDQGASLDRSVGLINSQGDAAESASRLQVAGSLLQGAGAVAGKWYSPNSAGAATNISGAQANSQFGSIA